MQSKVVSIKELTEDNPTFCLSVLRVFDQCHECPVFKKKQASRTLKKLKCKPHLNVKFNELFAQKQKALDQIAEIEKQLKSL